MAARRAEHKRPRMKSRSKVSASVEEAEWVRNLALRTSLKAVCIDMMLTPVTIASFIARVPQRAGTVDLIQSIQFVIHSLGCRPTKVC